MHLYMGLTHRETPLILEKAHFSIREVKALKLLKERKYLGKYHPVASATD